MVCVSVNVNVFVFVCSRISELINIYFAGSVDYRVTEESLMERLNTDMHEACLKIEKDCRSEEISKFIRQTSVAFVFFYLKLNRIFFHLNVK